jgi:O-antigen/teichoic acid export membrane protein
MSVARDTDTGTAKTLSRGRLLRLFSTAVIDQVMLSGTNLLVGVILIRFTDDFDYGVYVLVQSALLLLASAQGAWIAQPLSVMAARKSPQERRAVISAVTGSLGRIVGRVVPAVLVLPVAAYLTGLISGLMAWVLAFGVIAGWGALRRDYLRNILLIYSKPDELLRADTLYVGVLAAGVLWASFGTTHAIVWVTLALAAAAWAGTAGAHRAIGKDPGWVAGDVAAAWREVHSFGLWSLLGGVIYWLFGQSYSYILASRLDLKAVTDVNASRLLLMPAFVLSIGIQGLLSPTAARWNTELGFRPLVRRLLGIALLMGCADLLYFAVVWFQRDWLIGDVLHKNIGNRDHLLLLWAAVALIGLARDVLQCSLVALGRFRSMASQVGISAVVALTLMWFGTAWWGSEAVLIGQIAGELVNLGGIILLLREHGRAYAHA